MTRRPRIPGTRSGRTLYVLPSIPDELDGAAKDALALRNAATVARRCPGCGARAQVTRVPTAGEPGHLTFWHEPTCRALYDPRREEQR